MSNVILEELRKPKMRDVRLAAVGEHVIVRFRRGEQQTPGGIIVPDHDKADVAWGYVLSVGAKAAVKPEYGPVPTPGCLCVFNARAGVKIDADTKIVSIDDIFAVEDPKDEPPAPTEVQ